MKIHTAYCSGCDQNVRVVLRPGATAPDPTDPPDPHDLVCLEYGERCTGDLCPLFSVPTEEMRRRISEHGG